MATRNQQLRQVFTFLIILTYFITLCSLFEFFCFQLSLITELSTFNCKEIVFSCFDSPFSMVLYSVWSIRGWLLWSSPAKISFSCVLTGDHVFSSCVKKFLPFTFSSASNFWTQIFTYLMLLLNYTYLLNIADLFITWQI